MIYFNITEDGVVVLFAVYAKAEHENMTASDIKRNRGTGEQGNRGT